MQKTLSDLTIYLESYKKWCKSVDSLIKKEKKQYLFKTDSFENDDEIEIIENDQNNYNLNDSSTKPTISDLIKLIDYARFKKFDKFTYGEKLTNLLLKNLEETEICAENCRILLDLYKTNQTAKLSPLSDNFEDDVIVVEPARKVTLDDFKKVVNQLEEIACELPEKPTLLCIYHEIIKEENKIDQFIKEWNTNIPHVLRRYTNYLDNLSIEFDPVKIKKLKLLQNQSDWLHKVNSIEASELTIDKINYLIDKVTLNDLLASSEQSSQSIRQSYNQLIELLSIAQTWENKIEKLLAFDEPLSLETLEAAYKQAIEIPAKLFHVDRLSQVIKQVSNLKSNIKATLELRKPNLNYLTELLNETKKYPVIFDENLKIKVLYSNEWLIKLNNLFNFSQVCIQTAHLEHTEALNLIQILTPRIDLKTVIDTIHPNNNLNLSMPSILASKSKNKSKSGTVNKDSSDNSDNSLLVDLYAASTSGDSLREKIKFLELKEINFIKELRTLNTEKLKQIESVAMSANENRIEALKKNNFKCCACFKSIVSSIMSNSVDFCKLCLGIYHRNNSCKNASDSINSISSLCANCHRSRRPHTDQTYELLSEYEKLDISCSEERALEMFCHRFIKWQDRFNRVFDRDNLINLKLTINKQSINELRKIYAEMNPLKKVEINDLFIEGLLMEVSNENIQFLNEFCDLIEMNSDFQQILEGFGKIKPKKLSNQTDQGASSEQSSKACSKKSKSIHEIKSLNKLLKKNQKDAKKISRAKIGLTSGESDNREARSSIEIIEKKTDEQDDSKEDLETNESTDRDEEKSVTSKSSRSSNSSLFCICKRRSFGQMIGCDNEKCEIEWFHFECVRLKSKPKGKWYCPNCRPKF